MFAVIQCMMTVLSLGLGAWIYLKPLQAFELQKKFYARINWRIEPISFEKEEILLSNALEAYKSGQFNSIQAAASHFSVSKHKLRNRKVGTPTKKGRPAHNKALNQS